MSEYAVSLFAFMILLSIGIGLILLLIKLLSKLVNQEPKKRKTKNDKHIT